ncbi:hypothetical protein K490DRAFT_44970 [Saccharata proteae CBS 121410]|uniref:AHC1-like C2H2 zinc-finger domain-containing protein n=1 Tax=Saccharata proteae CBS 121410 TaxID=1314787 RepID=A0A9P4HU42_9PEZI|nr:hypothetical protein K490DRAFT_44970 [Saccharata proteae CBS 121410]
MQSMFRLPWSTENPAMDKAQYQKPRPVVDIPLLNKLKRRRTDSPEPGSPYGSHVAKKWKFAPGEVQPVAAGCATTLVNGQAKVAPVGGLKAGGPAPTSDIQPDIQPDIQLPPHPPPPAPSAPAKQSVPVNNMMDVDVADPTAYSPLQTVIETHFNQEILFKHNELRLIEQELAKCQIALEQLRRCHVIPYPGTDAASLDVSRGVGPALEPRAGFTTPQQPAPWGVADGPYTRHYAKWLIHDHTFDSLPVVNTRAHSGYQVEGRATRGSLAELPLAGKPRASRASAGSKMHALGDPSAPRIDPLLHKRSTDGKWVRLFCHHPDCRHSNFSNTQGFLNHCRIKHNQKFESHDQAAVECGVLVDVDELGAVLPGSEQHPPPSSTQSVSTAHPNGPFVHPLIKAPVAAKPVTALPPRKLPQHRPTVTTSSQPQSPSKTLRPQQSRSSNSAFVPSPQTPNLSCLLAQHGFNGDLNQLVDFARTKVDLAEIESDDGVDDDDASSTSPTDKKPPVAGAPPLSRLPARAGGMTLAPAGPRVDTAQPTTTTPSLDGHRPSNASSSAGGSPTLELSPHALESAPGLVTDHEDDDDDEEDERSVGEKDVQMSGMDDVVVEDGSGSDGERERAERERMGHLVGESCAKGGAERA